jgi:chromosomal replication initiation ATPase DnaA
MGRAQKERTLQAEVQMVILFSPVAQYFSLSIAELREGTGSQTVVLPGQRGMYRAQPMTAASLQERDRSRLRRKHHTTVLLRLAKVDEQCPVGKDNCGENQPGFLGSDSWPTNSTS